MHAFLQEQILTPYTAAFLGAARMMAALSVFPLFVRNLIPPMLRVVISLAFCLLVMPTLINNPIMQSVTSVHMAGIVIKEFAVGALIGFSFGMIFWAVENIGHMIDFQSGLTFSQSVDPIAGNQVSVHSRLILQIFIMYFISIGGLHLFLEMMYASYALWPILTYFPQPQPGWIDLFTSQTSMLLSLTLLFAAPIVIVLLIVELGFGMLNRAAPNFNVFDVSRPVKAWLATFVLLITLPYILQRSGQLIAQYRQLMTLLGKVMS